MVRTNNEKAEDAISAALGELESYEINDEFRKIYSEVSDEDLQLLFLKLHSNLISLFRAMNSRLPTKSHTAHYWADESRALITCVDTSLNVYYSVQESKYEFDIDEYYLDTFNQCRQFLSPSGGSELPTNMEKIELFYNSPIFTLSNTVKIETLTTSVYENLSMIGEGSYALVYKYKNSNYNKNVVMKRAKNNLDKKELKRFEKEFMTLKELSSPYIIDVYKYNSNIPEYSMEYMDINLEEYVDKNNSKLNKRQRKGIIYQILRGFKYIHSKSLLHRDINPNNILIKLYDHVPIVKISDFGLVREPNSTLTSVSTEYKGYYNDPVLKTIGFDKYSMVHEIYALIFVVYFVMTGRRNYRETDNPELDYLVTQGTHPDVNERPKSVDEIITLVSKL